MREERIIIEGKVKLGTTVTHVDDAVKSPAIVIIMGTGSLDRDGNGSGVVTNIYKNLAEEFAKLGFVSFRYDKRGTHESEGKKLSCGLSDLIDDAISVIRYAKACSFVDADKVIVCGHSEGAIIATLLSQSEKTAGLMLLGGAGCSLKDALYYQNRLLANELAGKKGIMGLLLKRSSSVDKNLAKIDKMFAKCSASKKDVIFTGGALLAAKWIREHGEVTSEKLVGLLKAYSGPVLAITGTADISDDYRCLEAFQEDEHITVFTPEKVNHILREVDDKNILNAQKQYVLLSKLPIQKETLDTISVWLTQFRS